MMIFIFGTRPKQEVVGKGEFFCPRCQTERHYERKKIKNYFSVYFIPVLPIGDSGEIIECTHCGYSFAPEVLDRKLSKPMPDVVRYLNTVKAKLERGFSVEYVVSDLTAEGLDRDVADNLITMAVGEERKHCPQCELTYAPGLEMCPECHVPLEKVQ